MRYLLLFYMFVLSNARPVEEEPYTQENDSVEELHQQFKPITYIENLKQILSDKVKKENHHLTINDMEAVKIILEELLINLSYHIGEILQGNKVEGIDFNKKIEDGIPDETFDIIKRNFKKQFQDINEEMLSKIVYALRKELFTTRRLLDCVIEESKRSLEANI